MYNRNISMGFKYQNVIRNLVFGKLRWEMVVYIMAENLRKEEIYDL